MPEALLIAAGGGGDVIAASTVAAALGLDPGGTLIATLAWERLLVDPAPGPRSPADFTGLSALGQQNVEIVAHTEPKHSGTSTLPRLRDELGHRLVLLDPRHGAAGIAEQIADLTTQLSTNAPTYLIDVGGDVLADGSEPGLKSPLADALMLAASAHLGRTIELLVAGPGLDGELSSTEALERLHGFGAKQFLTLNEHNTEGAMRALAWHPSEATALLVGSARGIRGVAEIRDAGTQIPLTPQSPHIWAITAADAAVDSLASALFDTTSFDEAEESLQQTLGWTELDYEHKKAAKQPLRPRRPSITDSVLEAVRQFATEAHNRGTDFVTFRRLAEAVGAPQAHEELRARLLEITPDRHRPPLWRVQT